MSTSRFDAAVARFSSINAEDPNVELVGGVPRPRELEESERLLGWILRLEPDASEALRLAAHCQHVGRFRVPRATYPEGRVGYLKWRTELARRHADTAAAVLAEVGYDADTIAAVRRIVLKQGLGKPADAQTMEDALCLAFLEHDFAAFAAKHADDKLIAILVKTWRKMSERARAAALALPLEGRSRALLERALAPSG